MTEQAELAYYGKGGFPTQATEDIPVYERRWFHKWLRDTLEAEAKELEKAQAKAKGGRHFTP